MSQTIAAPIPAAVDYERTLVLAIEVSNKSWVLAAQVPGLPHTKAKRTINPEAEALTGGHYRISHPRRRHGPQHRAGDCCLRGWMVGLLAGALAYEAWGRGVRCPAFQRAGRSSDAPRKV